MRKTLIASAIASAVLLPSVVSAQTATADAAPAAAAPASPHTFTANVALVSDYRFRGITQTFGQPAIQGGFDYSHASGIYLGNWDSNVSETAGYPNGNIEMDFYGGWKGSWGDFGVDLGVLEYYYPGSTKGGSAGAAIANLDKNPIQLATGTSAVDNTELYIAGSWKFLSLKYSHAVSDYFAIPDTKGSHYIDLSGSYDLGGGWGVNAHVGHLTVKNFGNASYTDWKLGVTKDIGGFVFGLAYVDTNAKDDCGSAATSTQPYCFAKGTVDNGVLNPTGKTYDGGKGTVVVSVSRTF